RHDQRPAIIDPRLHATEMTAVDDAVPDRESAIGARRDMVKLVFVPVVKDDGGSQNPVQGVDDLPPSVRKAELSAKRLAEVRELLGGKTGRHGAGSRNPSVGRRLPARPDRGARLDLGGVR